MESQMDGFDYFGEEFFDDNDTLEVCERCLGVRITSLVWAKLNHYMLAFFLKIKKNHTLTICPCCLQEQYKETEKCQKY